MKKTLLLLLLSIIFLTKAHANITLPALVGDGMVLQRGQPVKIWGKAAPGEAVSVSFLKKKYQVNASADGNWDIVISSLKAGGPYSMILTGGNTITINNILIGDVWICSGQSNMAFKTSETKNAEKEISEANYPAIHLFTVPTAIATSPQADVRGKWSACSPESVKDFSAVAYFFGRRLQQDINVPIGLIQTAFGGTPVEAWISNDGMKNEPVYEKQAADLLGKNKDSLNKQLLAGFTRWIDTIEKADPAYDNGKYGWTIAEHPDWAQMELPAYFENKNRSLRGRDGIIWFSKNIVLTAEQIKSNCLFNMGPVVDDDLVFFNGNRIGGTRDVKYASRHYTVPVNILHTGINNITIRVIDYGSLAGINGKPEQFYLQTPDKSVPLAGMWHYKVSLDTVFKTLHDSHINQEHVPCALFNAMIAPLINLGVKGVIWYQGENNTGRAYQYRSLFARMIKDWRKQFGQPRLPFMFVQLANFGTPGKLPQNSDWAELREAQAMGLKLPATGMVTAIDLGEATNIHPKDKQDVGIRLALEVLGKVYQEHNTKQARVFDKVKFAQDRCIVHFKVTGDGLLARDNGRALAGFQADTTGNGTFVYIPAFISGKSNVVINGTGIKAIRYAWADNPGELNLINSAGMPAFPFRTDNYKETTFDARYDKNN